MTAVFGRAARPAGPWDLTALLNAADARASQPERHLWLARLLEWLRHDTAPAEDEPPAGGPAAARTPKPVLRLRHLLNVLQRHPEHRERIRGMAESFWREVDGAALFADLGFATRHSLTAELRTRLAERLLPRTPETRDLASLFGLLFRPRDAAWVEAMDEATWRGAAALLAPAGDGAWRRMLLDAITMLVSAVRAAGFSPALRQRMDPEAQDGEPFRLLARAADHLAEALEQGRESDALHEAAFLRGLLDRCVRASDSVTRHLEEHGVSMDIAFQQSELRQRCARIDTLLACVLTPEPLPELRRLLLELLEAQRRSHGLRALATRHATLWARQFAERSAETGSHYITRDRAEWRDMLARAAGGGAVLAGTTLVKFGIGALGLAAFWTGLAAGINYAISFVIVMLAGYTVATKQPAMTAPAMAESLEAIRARGSDGPEGPAAAPDPAEAAAIEAFVDRVAQLIRSQTAGILGNLAVCAPFVLLVQWLTWAVLGHPVVGEEQAAYVLHSLTLLGPTLLYAVFTGFLLFGSSLVAGWCENAFVFHKLDSAIAWNPRIVARLGPARARRWAGWARRNVSGLAANISLGLMLGLVPVFFVFFGVPLEVRHVTLSTGQLAAALGAIGWPLLAEPAFWWCVAGIVGTGFLNVAVSFLLAFRLALRARGLRLGERSRVRAAIRRRLWRRPLEFLLPPREA